MTYSKIKKLSIVMKVSMLAGSVAALASLIVGTLIFNGSSDIVYQNSLNRLQYETNIKSLQLIADIKNLTNDAQYLAGTPPISGIPRAINNGGLDPLDNSSLTIWKSRLTTIFAELIRAKSNYLQIRYIGVANNGKELVRVDRKGNLIQNSSKNELQKKGNTLYFKNAIKINPGEVYLSDISLNREFGKISKPHSPVIRAATPIYINKKLFGILVINMAFGDIFKELIKNTPRELTPYVTNEKGYFLAHPKENMTYGFDLKNNNRIQTVYPDFNLQNNADIRDTEFTSEINGDVVHVVKSYFDPSQKKRFLAVMLATSYANLQSGSDKLRLQSYIIIGVLVILSLIFAALLASKLMRPLQFISKASEDLANGKKISDLPINSADEIGELANSFNYMRHQLEDKERELLVSQSHVHHANKMISLGEMAARMAHEINSPIQAISLMAQRVQRKLDKGMDKEDINTSMEKITSNVKKISEIIDSLRNVSRTSTEDEFKNTKLKDIVNDVLHITEERFKVNNVNFKINYGELSENMLIQCQRLQISQVLINLVNNAFDAINEKTDKWININFKKINHKIQISVTDSGSGIPKDIAKKIFEPMYTTKDVGKGTGLGLSISMDIILKHNGDFFIDETSKNTNFVIGLPLLHSTI